MINKPDQDLILTLKDVSSLPYDQQYGRWVFFLSELESNQSQNYLNYLSMFLELFPYNFIYWQKYINLNKPNVIEAYQTALTKNSKCPELWKLYLEQIKKQFDASKYKKQLQRAISQVGADINSSELFQEYYELLTNTNAKYEFFKKMFTRPLINLQIFLSKFDTWFPALTQEEMKTIYYRQTKQDNQVDYQQFIRTEIQRIYKQTLAYRQKRLQIHQKINHFYFSDHPDRSTELEIWRKYIYLQRSYKVIENISYCYQRALLSHTQIVQLWEEVFYYLQNQTGKYLNVLTILRNHREFFINFDPKLYYYWCDLEERENSQNARAMYIRLQTHKKIGEQSSEIELHPFFRHIQMQVRHENLLKAKQLFDQLLRINSNNSEITCYILVQYANFALLRFRQRQFVKSLYNIYFVALHYNSYLFQNYLQFLRQYQNNEGYYDELMSVLIQGYEKALKTNKSEATKCIKLIKQHLRVTLKSINLIKLSQKKFYQLIQESQQNQNSVQNGIQA